LKDFGLFWRIFWEDYIFCMVKYLSFHNSSFALRWYFFNTNGKAKVRVGLDPRLMKWVPRKLQMYFVFARCIIYQVWSFYSLWTNCLEYSPASIHPISELCPDLLPRSLDSWVWCWLCERTIRVFPTCVHGRWLTLG
jgi:hypothetical protein